MNLFQKENRWILVWVLGCGIAVPLSLILGYFFVVALLLLIPIVQTVALGMHEGTTKSALWLLPGPLIVSLTLGIVSSMHLEAGSTTVLVIGLLIYFGIGEYLLSHLFNQKLTGYYFVASVVGVAVLVGLFYAYAYVFPKRPHLGIELLFFSVLASLHGAFSVYGVHLGYGRKVTEAA